jgi:signal transduction histidine kinase/DNA-binding response OmpR family regulator
MSRDDTREPSIEPAAESGAESGAESPAGDLIGMLRAAGDVGHDLLAVDWAATPLGPTSGWPQSLCTVVRILLGSRFAMWMAWGPELTFFCNDAYRRDTLGTKYPWALGRPAREVWAEIWPDIEPRIERVITDGVATWDEGLLLFLERSGYVEETYHTFSYSPLTDDHGRITGMLCVVSEDTDRVIGERRMRTLRDLGSDITALRAEPDVLDAARRHIAANPQCLPFTLTYLYEDDGTARLAGTTGIAAGHPAAPGVLDPTDGRAVWPVAQVGSGDRVDVDLAAFRSLPTGAWTQPPVAASLVPLPHQSGGRPYGFLVVGLNRHRPLDEAYRGFLHLIAGQLAAGLATARAYQAERRRAESLAELDRAKTAFFTNVSHEFRTPLTLMLGPAEDALSDRDDALSPAQRQRVEVLQRNALRLLRLVNSLLDFSRLQSGRTQGRFEPVDLAAYTVDLAGMFGPAIERAGLILTLDCPTLGVPVHVDREMWADVVLNLLSNALKFTFSGGITVSLREVEGFAELTVADTGIGIEPADRERLFERFHRVVGVRSRSFEGSGIGLALVAELAALHGGTATVTSEPSHGSEFRVRVGLGTAHLPPDQIVAPPGVPGPNSDGAGPASAPHIGAPHIGDSDAGRRANGLLAEAMRWLEPVPPSSAGPETRQPEADGRPRVLVVDDNGDLRGYLTALLSDTYEVQTAVDGVEALELVHERPPDLVLTDVMMPRLDGFGLLNALREDPVTALVPVVMLSARAGDEATVEGLDAGADDYLVKPFSARELRARVRANLELDRTRRAGRELDRSRRLLDQAQRLAGVGSWELDLQTGSVTASEEFIRQIGLSARELREDGFEAALARVVDPQDVERVRAAVEAAAGGRPLDLELAVTTADGRRRIFHTLGELVSHPDGRPARLRGSNQDVTEQRRAERAPAAAAATQEAAAREHRIAEELQLSLLPARRFTPDHLDIATFYRAGVEGTHVGGDWFDVIALGADRTALVIGDVMGRGVRAAAVMGQLRAAVRAYARLDLPPADLLELLDGVVRDLGDDQIVTCLYAVYDPGDRSLTYANAGHLPPLLVRPGQPVERLVGAAGPPLGTGPFTLVEEHRDLPYGAGLALYTDGLVEHRDSDIEAGISTLAEQLVELDVPLDDLPSALVDRLLPNGPDDDVAVLVVRVADHARRTLAAVRAVPVRQSSVRHTRDFVAETLRLWGLPARLLDDVLLLVSELVTNAVVHGRPPIELRLRHTGTHLVIEAQDAASFLPRKLRPTVDDEHGRGLQLVAALADRWGTRPTGRGKSVWCVVGTGSIGKDAVAHEVVLPDVLVPAADTAQTPVGVARAGRTVTGS